MQIGKTIRKYRKEEGMTQEEMAKRLGVTTPAVNKWENDNSYPDITLLAPIARLLGISLDTLLSFQEELTTEEITSIIMEVDQKLKTSAYDEVFLWSKSIIETYPNCLTLIWQLASLLDAQRLIKDIPNATGYDDYILSCYNRVLESEEETLRTSAADSLFGYYLRNEQYEKAEHYLQYYSMQNPLRKLKQATIYRKTNRTEDAYKANEELLFSEYQILGETLQNLYLLSLGEQNFAKAHLLVDKQQMLANLFDMGKYHEAACKLELATIEKDVDTILDTMEIMLHSLDDINIFTTSPLYEHMNFKKTSSTFSEQLKQELLNCFRDRETYGFLDNNERWKIITQQIND